MTKGRDSWASRHRQELEQETTEGICRGARRHPTNAGQQCQPNSESRRCERQMASRLPGRCTGIEAGLHARNTPQHIPSRWHQQTPHAAAVARHIVQACYMRRMRGSSAASGVEGGRLFTSQSCGHSMLHGNHSGTFQAHYEVQLCTSRITCVQNTELNVAP